MNLIRQRDDLKVAANAKVISQSMLEAALSSPVFQWWHGADESVRKLGADETEFIMTNLIEPIKVEVRNGEEEPTVLWPRFTPYDCFRISLMDSDDYYQWWITSDRMTCFHCDNKQSHEQVKCWTLHHKEKQSARHWHFGMWANEKRVELPNFSVRDESPDEVHEYRSGRVGLKASAREMTRYASHVVRLLGVFMFDIYGSGNSVVKVSPKPDHTKSVQWRLAREHYLVLRRQQVEKLRESKGSVTDDQIIRSAHWRRAHLRRLSAGRFVNKRGLLVPVKRAWVGPTEWEGKDGKVYTVVGIEPPSLTGIS